MVTDWSTSSYPKRPLGLVPYFRCRDMKSTRTNWKVVPCNWKPDERENLVGCDTVKGRRGMADDWFVMLWRLKRQVWTWFAIRWVVSAAVWEV